MAYLLDMDVSNLSKYERGLKTPNLKVYLGYHVITGTPIDSLVDWELPKFLSWVSDRVTALIVRLEQGMQTPKIKHRTSRLYDVLNALTLLADKGEKGK